MKLIFYVLLILILSTLHVDGQTAQEILQIQSKTNVSKLREFSKYSNEKYKNNQKKLREYAKVHGWPESKVNAEGKKQILFEISDDNQPIYIEALDSQGNLTVRSNKLYTGGGLNLDLHGESMTAAVFDGVLDIAHPALENRAINMNSAYFDPLYADYHGTAVAGQIMASGDYNSEYIDADGKNWGKAIGIGFKANVHGYLPGNHVTNATIAASNGLLVSNHSYGYYPHGPGEPGSYYSFTARDFDNIMHLAPYYLSVWACGNNNSLTAYDRLTAYATIKNGLSVANTREVIDYTTPDMVVRTSSSRGPTDDGRIKPDIAAAGSSVRVLDPSIGPNGYKNAAGTSFSAPTVSGAILLFQQHYNNLNSHFMRSATVKAVALHTTFEAGPYPGPDISFGWGLMNTERAANAITNNGGTSLILEDSLVNTGNFSKEFVASGDEPLMATICWTDLPGIAVSDGNTLRQLINDLDVRIVANGTTFFPWKLDSANIEGAALKGDNSRDNVEKIEILNPVAGQTYTLNINHKGTLQNAGQRFSLIVTGLEACVANRNIYSPVNATSQDSQQAGLSITAFNILNASSEVIYHAGEEVVMKDGFAALGGSVYRAYVEGCTNDYNARKGVVERPVVTYNIPPQHEEAILADNAIYPNPGNGIFKVNLTGLSEGYVKVINLDGNEFFRKSFDHQSEMDVNIKKEVPGTYIIKVFTENKVLTKRIIKN